MAVSSKKQSVRYIKVSEAYSGQRIDNFLFREYKNIPKSYVYRVIRSGELRINSKRVPPSHKLSAGDRIRIPPIAHTSPVPPCLSDVDADVLLKCIIFEDEEMLVIDKPAHLAVHTGTAHSFGLIDLLKHKYSDDVGLVHRLDKDTSGCLIVAKSRPVLLGLQKLFRESQIEKIYQVLVVGRWQQLRRVSMPLRRAVQKQAVADNGKHAITDFTIVRSFKDYSLMSVSLITGRTHQIRVHAAHCGHPVAGDNKYGDFSNNRELARLGLKRIFLHAHRVSFKWREKMMSFEAPLPNSLQKLIAQLDRA